MKPFRILDPARTEIFAISAHYESQAAGLGDEFLAVLSSTITLLRTNPELGAAYRAATRRFVLPRFPYSVIYLDEPDFLVFVAVAHHRQEPDYWKPRT